LINSSLTASDTTDVHVFIIFIIYLTATSANGLQAPNLTISAYKEVTKVSPQGSCCAPGYWNILYNSLLNIQFTKNSKAVTFADDLILAIRKETIRAAENISNIEKSKIAAWSRNNKINFNEDKSRVMVISRRKRKENKENNVYLNNKPLQQVSTMKYLGNLNSTTTLPTQLNEVANLYTA